MKKLVIHIGLHKTASTYLQQSYFPNYKNIQYLTRPFSQYNHEFNRMQYADSTLFDPQKFAETVDALTLKHEVTLISDEGLAGKLLGYGYINRQMIAERLSAVSKEFEPHVIMFIRGQQSMMASVFNQAVKSSLKTDKSINEFFWYPKKNFDVGQFNRMGNGSESMPLEYLYYNTNDYFVHYDCFLYYELIALYKRLFKNVHVFPYEQFRENPNDVLRKIDAIVGENIEGENTNIRKPLNASIPPDKIYGRVLMNRYHSSVNKVPFFNTALGVYINLSRRKQKVFLSEYYKFLEEIPYYYSENNRRIIRDYPEIGIQNYPDDYSTS